MIQNPGKISFKISKFCWNTHNFNLCTVRAIPVCMYLWSVALVHWASSLLLFDLQSMHSWADRRLQISITKQDISSKLLVFPQGSCAMHAWIIFVLYTTSQFLSRFFPHWPGIHWSNLEISNWFQWTSHSVLNGGIIWSSFHLTTIIMFSRTVTGVSRDSVALGNKQFLSVSKGHW